ncbi:MAG: N-acetyltransferase [Bacteroidetes bacterium]|nr:N-acetyltransferase [Bacteroidota bacterium]
MQVIHNIQDHQFEIRIEDHPAELQYRMRDNKMFFMHTWVPEEIGCKSIGSTLAKAGLDYARANGYKIVVYCPFVTAYIKKHPEYEELIDKNYRR